MPVTKFFKKKSKNKATETVIRLREKRSENVKIIKEHFNSICQMLNVIESRSNNSVMNRQNASHSNDKGFTGTSSYDEAKTLFETGYTDILDKIKTGVAENLKQTVSENRRHVRTAVVGYAPHVPNAILGLPNSMIFTETKPQKIKAVSIVAGITENCGTGAKEFSKSGIAVLGVVNTLELQGYRVNLKVAFYCAKVWSGEYTFGTVSVKDYREHLDLQKLCFPLAHPSMFRRFGFKWLETVPGLTSSEWAGGYGSQFNDMNFIKKNFLEENEFFIGLSLTKKCNYDPNKIIETMNLK